MVFQKVAILGRTANLIILESEGILKVMWIGNNQISPNNASKEGYFDAY